MRTKFFCTAVAFANILLGAGCERDNGEILRPPSPASKTLTVQWQQRSAPAPATVGTVACCPGGVLYALTERTVERSTDNGDTWTTVSTVADVRCIAAGPNGELLLGSVNAGILSSHDGGGTWTKTGLTNASVYRIVVSAKGCGIATYLHSRPTITNNIIVSNGTGILGSGGHFSFGSSLFKIPP